MMPDHTIQSLRAALAKSEEARETAEREVAEIKSLSEQYMEDTGSAYAYVGIRDYAHAKEALSQALARIEELEKARASWRDIPVDDETLSYVMRYGGRCRDCADHFGVCPGGLPCVPDEAKGAIRHVLRAINYGMANGFLPATPIDGGKG